MVRRLGIGLAVILRIALLFVLMQLIRYVQDPLFGINIEGIVVCNFNFHSIIVLLGGVLIIYTATKEIFHMLSLDDLGHGNEEKRSVRKIIFWIVLMNLVFPSRAVRME